MSRDILLTAVCLTLTTTVLRAEEVDVYLLGGQSNMQGLGVVAELGADESQPPANVFFWNGKVFEPLIPGTTQTSTRKGEFGPELGFAHEIAGLGRPAYLIKYSASGMPLHQGWDGNRWVGGTADKPRTNFFPGMSAEDPASGRLYRAMRDRFQAGIAAIRAAGHTPIVHGFAWMQGEQDSKHEESAGSYAANLGQLRDRLAADLNVQRLPLVFGQVLPYPEPLPRFTHRDLIREQMAAADMDSGQPHALPLVRMISTDHLSLKADTVHYDTQGQWQLGQLMARGIPRP